MIPAENDMDRGVSVHRSSRMPVIHVNRPEFINWSRPIEEWIWKAQPVPWDMDKARALVSGEIDHWSVIIRPRVCRVRRLMFRAVQAHLAGQYVRATQLVCQAQSELNIQYPDLELIDVLFGLSDDLCGIRENARRERWLAQADWWTAGGKWPGGYTAAEPFWRSVALRVLSEFKEDRS